MPALLLLAWAARSAAGRVALALSAPFSSPGRAARRREAWARSSLEGLAATLGLLKGAFVKAGQFAAHRHDVVPGLATEAFAALRDRVPPLPLARIRPAVESELGAPLETLFASFEPEPLGAASMAQVHRATLPSGEEVAVKVQYPWLEASLRADLRLLRALLALAALLGRAPVHGEDRRRLFSEFAEGLREELDFEREAKVAGEIAANLAHDPRIVVPQVVSSHTTRRVLTMAFHGAVRITDREGLAGLGVAPRPVLEIVARAYAKQVFVDGLFHADPHPGNLFVIDEPGAARDPRVLFVDFGLSRRLAPELRRELRRGLHALIRRDLAGFVDGMNTLGMVAPGAEDRVRRAVEHMFADIGAQGGALAVRGSAVLALKDRAKTLLQETEGLQLPDDLLLFAKTLSYLFALGRDLDPDVDLVRLSLPYMLRFLAERD